MKVHLLRLIAILWAASTLGCAFSRAIPGTQGCFVATEVERGKDTSWAWLDDWTLLIRTRAPGNSYLIELSLPVVGLGFRPDLSFDNAEHSGKICSDDYLVVPGYEPERVQIRAVRLLTAQQAADLFAPLHHGAR